MARPFTPRVNRHVTYYNAGGKARPGTITTVTDATHINIRIARTGGTVAGAVKLAPGASVKASGWTPY